MQRAAVRFLSTTANMPALPYRFLSAASTPVALSPRLLEHFSEDTEGATLASTSVTYRDLSTLLISKRTALEREPASDSHSAHFVAPAELPDAASLTVESPLCTLLSTVIKPATLEGNKTKVNRSPYPLTYKVEDYVQMAAFTYFLEHGALLPLSACPVGTTDEEYLGGILTFANADLQRYIVGRAIDRDVHSIEAVQALVTKLFEICSEFDFRNGPIRRKFDGIKYCVKKVENVLYELAITDRTDDASEPAAKKAKTNGGASPATINEEEIFEIKKRYEDYDANRELVIKKCREIQKGAKNSIFALHRGDKKKAAELISMCETVGAEILVMIESEPTLRQGSFSNSLEEYAEAVLFQAWLEQDGKVLSLDEIKMIDEEEYIGGICDLSGEVGRVAVMRGTKRDEEGVQACLDTNLSILMALEGVKLPGKLSKKMDPLKESVKKLETVLYELSLIKAKGGGTVSVSEPTVENGTAMEE
jgi:predicted translin family RNA/ssDNA-binding protein